LGTGIEIMKLQIFYNGFKRTNSLVIKDLEILQVIYKKSFFDTDTRVLLAEKTLSWQVEKNNKEMQGTVLPSDMNDS